RDVATMEQSNVDPHVEAFGDLRTEFDPRGTVSRHSRLLLVDVRIGVEGQTDHQFVATFGDAPTIGVESLCEAVAVQSQPGHWSTGIVAQEKPGETLARRR